MYRLRPLFQEVKHTGFAGLMPEAKPRETLIKIYESTLEHLDKLPKEYPYRQVTTALTQHRLAVVNNEIDVNSIQAKFEEGPIEFIIHQAQAENSLAKSMLDWKPWEPLETHPPQGQWEDPFSMTEKNSST